MSSFFAARRGRVLAPLPKRPPTLVTRTLPITVREAQLALRKAVPVAGSSNEWLTTSGSIITSRKRTVEELEQFHQASQQVVANTGFQQSTPSSSSSTATTATAPVLENVKRVRIRRNVAIDDHSSALPNHLKLPWQVSLDNNGIRASPIFINGIFYCGAKSAGCSYSTPNDLRWTKDPRFPRFYAAGRRRVEEHMAGCRLIDDGPVSTDSANFDRSIHKPEEMPNVQYCKWDWLGCKHACWSRIRSVAMRRRYTHERTCINKPDTHSTCQFCGISFRTSVLFAHEHQCERVSCDTCGKLIARGNLKAHKTERCEDDPLFLTQSGHCDSCGKFLTGIQGVNKHWCGSDAYHHERREIVLKRELETAGFTLKTQRFFPSHRTLILV